MVNEGSPRVVHRNASSTGTMALVVAWAAVSLPLLWGVAQTIRKAMALFQ
jgi:hypothetical protein